VAAFAVPEDGSGPNAELAAARLSELRREYTRLFTHPTNPMIAVCESLYCYDPKRNGPVKPVAFINATALDADRFYREAGYQPGTTIQLPADHAACELGFLAYLLQIKAKALQTDDRALSADAQQMIADFSHQHLTNWMDRFFAEVEQVSESGLFQALGGLGAQLIDQLNQKIPSAAATLGEAGE
jgi:TorA maturation chaperone TorD